jgi:hypothetical protein
MQEWIMFRRILVLVLVLSLGWMCGCGSSSLEGQGGTDIKKDNGVAPAPKKPPKNASPNA